MLRYLTAGESHGKALTVIVEGLPAGVKIDIRRINRSLSRRQGGYGRGGRMVIEKDEVEITSGVRGSETIGSPIALHILNRDWQNWSRFMDPLQPQFKEDRIVTRPRPGHADLAGALKYRQQDLRNVLERASARETAARVAAGALVQEFLEPLGIRVQGQVAAVGSVKAEVAEVITDEKIYDNLFYCSDDHASELMRLEVDKAKEQGDTLGGIFLVIAEGLPAGLGTYAHWDRRLDALLAQAVMSIPSVKGVEIGAGFLASALPGSKVHDEIVYSTKKGYHRKSNNAGGLEGGVTNGERLVIRAAVKPIPTLLQPLNTVDIVSKEPCPAVVERSDVCVVPAAAIVGEMAVSWVLACAMLEKFGGDHLEETQENYRNYLARQKEAIL